MALNHLHWMTFFPPSCDYIYCHLHFGCIALSNEPTELIRYRMWASCVIKSIGKNGRLVHWLLAFNLKPIENRTCMCFELFRHVRGINGQWSNRFGLTFRYANVSWSNKLFGNRLNELIFMHLVDAAHIFPHKLSWKKRPKPIGINGLSREKRRATEPNRKAAHWKMHIICCTSSANSIWMRWHFG